MTPLAQWLVFGVGFACGIVFVLLAAELREWWREFDAMMRG